MASDQRDRDVRALIEHIVREAELAGERERDELRRELAAHFEEGSPEHFGSPRAIARSFRGARRQPSTWLRGGLMQDVRFGFRMLRRAPGFSALAIVCLTLGIGANAAVFGWIEGVLLRPYPLVSGQERLYAIAGTDLGSGDRTEISWPDFLDLERNATVAETFVGEKITGTSLNLGDRAQRVPGSMVSANYFEAVGVRPILGRGFLPGEDLGRATHPVTVISYQLWQERFHGDTGVIGQTQWLAGLPHEIVGVAPPGFYGTFVGYAFQFWVPMAQQPQFDAGVYKLEDRSARFLEPYVRLKPGVSLAQAQAEFSAIAAQLQRAYPVSNRGRGVQLFPLWQTPFNAAASMVPVLGTALVVVFAVLLIACANVGNLLLVRALSRQQEMTIRLAIGATSARLVRQLLTEGVILSALASAGALLVARWLRGILTWVMPPRSGIILRLPGELDWRVVALCGFVGVVATLLFALVPALMAGSISRARCARNRRACRAAAARRACARRSWSSRCPSALCSSSAPACCSRVSTGSVMPIRDSPPTAC